MKHVECRYRDERNAHMAQQQQQALAARLEQQGLQRGSPRPFMLLLVTAVVHKVCRFQHNGSCCSCSVFQQLASNNSDFRVGYADATVYHHLLYVHLMHADDVFLHSAALMWLQARTQHWEQQVTFAAELR